MLSEASVVLAPGLHRRMHAATRLSLPDALAQAWHVELWLASHRAAPLAACVVVALAAASRRCPPTWYLVAPRLIKAGLALGMVLLPLGGLFIAFHGGGGAPARLADSTFLFGTAAALTLAAALGFDLCGAAGVRRVMGDHRGAILRSAAACIALVAAAGLPRLHAALAELPLAFQNQAAMRQRMQDITAERQAGQTDIVVRQTLAPLSILPTSSGLDLSEDPGWFANREWATFFGVHSIRLAPKPAP